MKIEQMNYLAQILPAAIFGVAVIENSCYTKAQQNFGASFSVLFFFIEIMSPCLPQSKI